MYIKEAVTNACPMSIDDLVKKMIDCVQAVPPGYLKPVVEASIKRSQSLDLGGLGKTYNISTVTIIFKTLKHFIILVLLLF